MEDKNLITEQETKQEQPKENTLPFKFPPLPNSESETKPKTKKVDKDFSKEVQQQMNQAVNAGLDQAQLATIISQSISQALIQQQELMSQREEQKEQERYEKQQQQFIDKSGLASMKFKKLMEKEIEEGRYTQFFYYASLAKRHGRKATLNISGYKMDFIAGQSTKVPNVLLNHVVLKFEGLSVANGAIRGVVVEDQNKNVLVNETKQAEDALMSELSGKR